MNVNETEFYEKLLAMFKIEAREHLNLISSGLIGMEQADSHVTSELVETMYREAHSLKGAARSVNCDHVVSLCQSIENAFSALKHGRIILSDTLRERLQQLIDFCSELVESGEISPRERSTTRELMRQLDTLVSEESQKDQPTEILLEVEKPSSSRQEECGESVEEEEPPALTGLPKKTVVAPPSPAVPETVRISTSKLDALLIQAEEMISLKLATGQRVADLKDLKKSFDLWKKGRQRERSVGISDSFPDTKPLLTDPFLVSLDSRLTAMLRVAEYDHRTSGTMVDKLLDDMKKALMLPASSIMGMFPRMVRDLARSAGKKIELTIHGGETEIDKRVLEEVKDPLLHLVRNSIDHGIEAPEERERKGKPACGSIRISVCSRDDTIEMTVSDDGVGIDATQMKSSAVKHGLISREAAEKLAPREALQLVFHSGITTSPMITDISGRGLGLAIVREKVENLNGAVTVETQSDQGTIFRMNVPLTLTTFRGILVRVSDQLFVLPSVNVERVARVKTEAIQTVENHETLVFDGRPVSLVRLCDVLELEIGQRRQQGDDEPVQVVVLGSAEKRMAFMVDEVLREQEVLVKPLGRQLSRVRNIAAATVLGSGNVVPILNISDLMKSAIKRATPFIRESGEESEKSRTVLVVEDSITARTLLKNILESAGYDVQTAIDGVDGITALKSREFDVVVSDVEMPRMNGFELTSKIRSDRKLSELPVILVTALDSREDRERGIDVGANAYIVKSSFDQSNLLEVIGRLT